MRGRRYLEFDDRLRHMAPQAVTLPGRLTAVRRPEERLRQLLIRALLEAPAVAAIMPAPGLTSELI